LKTFIYSFILTLIVISCGKKDNLDGIASGDTPQETDLYFPPTDGNEWATLSAKELSWNLTAIEELYQYLETNNTRAFIVLKDGKIVIEEYWGMTVTGTRAFDEDALWYWASAGKTITATLVGIAQQEGDLNINDKTSDYLGSGWTNMSASQENMITIKDQLTMTTGLDYVVSNIHCTDPICLNYKADPGTQWFYHNAPYTLLDQVVENATSVPYDKYTNNKLESITGMDGHWVVSGYNNTYWSTARDMARFGLLMLNKGKWKTTAILENEEFYDQMISTSQNLNPSYGYLWWLNGKESIILPSLPNSFNMPLSDAAPDDLVAGMGKNGQFIEIIPSQNLVVVRMGEAPDESLVPVVFHNEMWEMISAIFD